MHPPARSPRLLAACVLLAGTAGALGLHQLEARGTQPGPQEPRLSPAAIRADRAAGDATPVARPGPLGLGWVEPHASGGAGIEGASRTAAPAAVPGGVAVRPDGPPAATETGPDGPARLVVTGYRVNVRTGPGTDAPVMMQLDVGDELIGTGRHGDWIRIAIAGPSRHGGWVHASFVRPLSSGVPASATAASGGMAPVVGHVAAVCAAGTDTNDRLGLFRALVERLINEPVRRVARVGVFTGIESPDEGVVRLTALPAWFAVPEAARRADLDLLVRLWAALHEADQALVVGIIDGDGNLAMEHRR